MHAVIPDPPHAHGRSKQADHRTGQPHRGHCPQPFEPTEHGVDLVLQHASVV